MGPNLLCAMYLLLSVSQIPGLAWELDQDLPSEAEGATREGWECQALQVLEKLSSQSAVCLILA